jgi:1-deoxy-D-xylulose-5-phosphate synthase
MAAADEAELVHMVATAAAHDDGPIAFRYPRGDGVGVELPERGTPLEIGKGRMIREGKGVALLSFGTRLRRSNRPPTRWRQGHPPHHRRRPLRQAPRPRPDPATSPAPTTLLITVEEGAIGGFGSHVAQLLAEEGVFDRGLRFRSMVLPDIFIDQASPADMYAVARLNASDIEAKVLEVLGVAKIGTKRA